ncbi:MAG: L,D-transpeptidase [Anaerolineae bacterium]|nr:L,D-transpeptidase [Anaerolineae bacterium]
MLSKPISRRDFLKTGFLGASALLMRPWLAWAEMQSQWPQAELLGRNCVGGMINLRARPSVNSQSLGNVYEDTVFVWLREVVGEAPAGLYSRRWVETPEGYLYAPVVQPVRNLPNQPLSVLPERAGVRGMWAEVTIPYVDLRLINEAPQSPWFKEVLKPRLYYSQVIWVDDIRTNEQGQIFYRVNERAGTYGDVFWAAAEAFRPLTEEDLEPIHPEVTEKKIVVDLNHQTLSCYEGNNEVYFCRVSSGAKYDYQGNPVEEWATPLGPHPIWRKLVSIHMSGGGTGAGWDTPGVAWTSLFVGTGVAIHSTFWHNDFGTPRSHGCVNVTPEDAKWIFRWTLPYVPYEPGDVMVEMPGGTMVEVVEG